MNDSSNPSAPDVDTVWRPDVTVAAIVPRGETFLLVEEIIRGKLMLNQPAGHLEANESLPTASVRETLEETGWEIQLDALVGIYQWTAPDSELGFLRFTFAAHALRHHAERALDAGIVRTLWLTRDEIAAESARLRSPMVLRSIDDYLAGKRFPLDAVHAMLPAPLPRDASAPI
ncbi:NUDIX hydrolase [Pseudolysobacter antarcticus]|uniref:Phosphatase NudJ n=1 Tax=Pseudolysobacter antarcticus TaxID=2511995 RepID=A0A411HJ18_9GAMM|nr:NUDIX hydrolase [Pseudolysobacter antarcticus]QBB70522.1 NUDIX hydrolase [Pseudolysobacter antarcticus]